MRPALLLLVLLIGCAPQQVEDRTLLYQNNKLHISLKYSEDWTVEDKDITVFYPKDRDEERVSLVVINISKRPITEREYLDNLNELMNRTYSGYALASRSGDRLVYSFKYSNRDFTEMKFIAVHRDLLCLITYTAASERFQVYLPDVETIIASLRFDDA